MKFPNNVPHQITGRRQSLSFNQLIVLFLILAIFMFGSVSLFTSSSANSSVPPDTTGSSVPKWKAAENTPNIELMRAFDGDQILVTKKSPSISTSKIDYQPGEAVTLYGEGFQPREMVAISLRRLNGPSAGKVINLTAQVDERGDFSNSDFRPDKADLGVLLTADATGLSSGLGAQVTFTDGPTQIGGLGLPTDYTVVSSIDFINGSDKTLVPGSQFYATKACNKPGCVPEMDAQKNGNGNVVITLPFAFTLYDRSFTQVSVTSEGVIQFDSNNNSSNNSCLPAGNFNYTLSLHDALPI